jgi:hypothetical protein
VVEPVLIAARRPDSPRLETGFRNVIASAQPKVFVSASPNGLDASARAEGPRSGSQGSSSQGSGFLGTSQGNGFHGSGFGSRELSNSALADGEAPDSSVVESSSPTNGNGEGAASGAVVRRRAVRIVKLTDNALTPGNREQQLLDRLVRSQGRGAISRAADDLWDSKFVAPKRQEIQIQLLEHENETRARDAVFAMAELLQREAPIKRPVLDQRLRRLETSAEDPITRDAAGALRRSMRVHHGP